MQRLVTEQFIDLLRRSGKPTDLLTQAGPLPDLSLNDGGYSILRQQFRAIYADGTAERYIIFRGTLRQVA